MYYTSRIDQFTVPATVVLTCMAPIVFTIVMFTTPALAVPVSRLELALPLRAIMLRLLTAPELAKNPRNMELLLGKALQNTKPCVPAPTV